MNRPAPENPPVLTEGPLLGIRTGHITARKIAIEIFVFLFLSVHCGNFIEQIKKPVIYTLGNALLLYGGSEFRTIKAN